MHLQDPVNQVKQLNKATAERIVNEYGRAMARIGQLRRSKVSELIEDMTADGRLADEVSHNLLHGRGRYHNIFSPKADKTDLPYPPETIRDAIELLLEHEIDPDNIQTLQLGLQYLEYFH